jgi:hypothetical protein
MGNLLHQPRDWAETLTVRDFPQLQGTLCPLEFPRYYDLGFTVVPGEGRSILFFGCDSPRAFNSSLSAGQGFGTRPSDTGYILEFEADGFAQLWRSAGRSDLRGLAAAEVGTDQRSYALWVRPGHIVLRSDTEDILMESSDETHRGAYFGVMRRIVKDRKPRDVPLRAAWEHEDLEPSRVTELAVRYPNRCGGSDEHPH